MFEQTFVNSQARTRKPWTVGASLAIQSLAVIAALIVPLLHIASLEAPARDLPLFVMLKPLTQPPVPVRAPVAAPATPRVFHNPLAAPTRIPNHIDMTPDAPEPPAIVWAGNPTMLSGSAAVPGFPFTAMPAPPRPVAPKPAPPAPQAPLRVGTGVQAANLIFGPKPVYPQLAKAARVQGTIKLQAIIAVDGTIKNLKVISGPPLLVNSAMEAVRRWQYKPTLLNGSPVEVITEIDVNFTLN
jgi:periplasmic protein TonB